MREDIVEKIKNYEGSNDFVCKVKKFLVVYGRLSDRQVYITDKIIKKEEKSKISFENIN
jgi:hypothetical protein